LPKAKAAVSPVVGKFVGSVRELHAKIIDGRKPSDLP